MTESLFQLSFLTATPFWALMIFAPTWNHTRRVVASPYIVVPPLLIYLCLLMPVFIQFWTAVSNPDLDVLQTLLGERHGAAAVWAHLVGFDLFVGRWIYLDSRIRHIHPWIISPILALTILLSPFGLLGYLAIRASGPALAHCRTPIANVDEPTNRPGSAK
ncbi:ABA4-like family protein [Nocardia sp. CDC160]|uniref:ABA4-like family protein n=1 Tax=Nocardia sp. CDC160 TaxID=3112166 RepID=UPI002DBDD557|nr:ABA4-like family protein [Nocardia sp. CDC160]MEC3920246.1 ABA4-like family protein [Nocardia sp. CDC160]